MRLFDGRFHRRLFVGSSSNALDPGAHSSRISSYSREKSQYFHGGCHLIRSSGAAERDAQTEQTKDNISTNMAQKAPLIPKAPPGHRIRISP